MANSFRRKVGRRVEVALAMIALLAVAWGGTLTGYQAIWHTARALAPCVVVLGDRCRQEHAQPKRRPHCSTYGVSVACDDGPPRAQPVPFRGTNLLLLLRISRRTGGDRKSSVDRYRRHVRSRSDIDGVVLFWLRPNGRWRRDRAGLDTGCSSDRMLFSMRVALRSESRGATGRRIGM